MQIFIGFYNWMKARCVPIHRILRQALAEGNNFGALLFCSNQPYYFPN